MYVLGGSLRFDWRSGAGLIWGLGWSSVCRRYGSGGGCGWVGVDVSGCGGGVGERCCLSWVRRVYLSMLG